MKALIIIDMQNSFLPGGSLEVNEGDKIISAINFVQDSFDIVVATQDWHPANHVSFASNHTGKQLFETITLENGTQQQLWPIHCVQGTEGAQLSKYLYTNKVNMIIRKGMDPNVDSYSCFFDNNKEKDTGLNGYLKGLGVDEVYICGLAGDYCVFYSIQDSLELGYKTSLIVDATKAVDEENFKHLKAMINKRGCNLITSEDIWQQSIKEKHT